MLPGMRSHAQIGGIAGAFSRLGFGARGQGMGNAMAAIPRGIISSHYNPALTPFQKGHVLYGNYSFLALDRKLNQISYTQSIQIRKRSGRAADSASEIGSTSGVSAGWINAGDADIQGYDSDGFKTDMLSVFENQFFLNFGNTFSKSVAAGFNVKFYYSGLYDGVTSSGFGADVGLLFFVTQDITAAVVVKELLTKYKWDTSQLYGQQRGNATENSFARIVTVAGSAVLPVMNGIVAAEVEMLDGKTFLARLGVEADLVEQVQIRAGVDRIDLSGENIDPRPSAGFTVTQPLAAFLPSISYAFIFEPVAPAHTHVLSFALTF